MQLLTSGTQLTNIMYRKGLALALACAAVAHAHRPEAYDANDGREDHRVTYDVAVIGGGSSGSYAAARLKQQGFKVVVIEREGRLGGMLPS